MKATHNGTCQICGHFQKLPNGKLSKHGYTKRWGFFSGTCYGAKELPFELSKGLIDQAIANALARAEELRTQANEVEVSTSNTVAKYVSYRDVKMDSWAWYRDVAKSSSIPMKGELSEEVTEVGTRVVFTFSYRGAEHKSIVEFYHGKIDSVRTMLHNSEAESLRHRAAQMDEYATWQKERIKDWKVTELKAV